MGTGWTRQNLECTNGEWCEDWVMERKPVVERQTKTWPQREEDTVPQKYTGKYNEDGKEQKLRKCSGGKE
jgi:hypothetical protein